MVAPGAIDGAHLCSAGWLVWNNEHGPENLIGRPERAEMTPDGLRVTCLLYPEVERARSAWALCKARSVAFEVSATETTPGRVALARISLTTRPPAANAWHVLTKSLSVAEGKGFQRSDIDSPFARVLYQPCRHAQHYDSWGRFYSLQVLQDHLLSCVGASPEMIAAFVRFLVREGIELPR